MRGMVIMVLSTIYSYAVDGIYSYFDISRMNHLFSYIFLMFVAWALAIYTTNKLLPPQ